MEKVLFQSHLIKASTNAIDWARQHVTNTLPSAYRYLLYPNQSYDRNPLQGDEEVFPGDSLPAGKFLGPLNVEQTVDYLWRNLKVPEWINVTVKASDTDYSYLELKCCGRFTAQIEMLYHEAEGFQPFHVLSPSVPPKWESLEASGKFDIYWHGRNPLTKA